MRNTMPKTVALLAGSALLAAGTAHADRSEWPTNFTVGTASQGGTYFVYGSGWANFIAEAQWRHGVWPNHYGSGV